MTHKEDQGIGNNTWVVCSALGDNATPFQVYDDWTTWNGHPNYWVDRLNRSLLQLDLDEANRLGAPEWSLAEVLEECCEDDPDWLYLGGGAFVALHEVKVEEDPLGS